MDFRIERQILTEAMAREALEKAIAFDEKHVFPLVKAHNAMTDELRYELLKAAFVSELDKMVNKRVEYIPRLITPEEKEEMEVRSGEMMEMANASAREENPEFQTIW